MKQAFLAFVNKPILVAAVSIVIAVAVVVIVVAGESASQSITLPSGSSEQTAMRTGPMSLAFVAGGRIQSVSVKAGDSVQKGEILASLTPENTLGAITQAKAAYSAATAAYKKVLNGATGPAIDVARAAVKTAESNLAEVKRQQEALVGNSRRKLYSDDLVAVSTSDARRSIIPVISGAYNGTEAGEYDVYFASFNDLTNRGIVSFMGIEKGTATKSDVPQTFGTHGLLIAFPDLDYLTDDRWTIEIPNRNGANYVANFSAYQSAQQTHDQAIAGAQAALEQAQANLALTAAAARPEDVSAAQAQMESARGALQIAEAAYENRVLRAPEAGVVTAVHVTVGQIASPNVPAVELDASAQ